MEKISYPLSSCFYWPQGESKRWLELALSKQWGGIRSLLVSKENNAARGAIQTANPPTDQRAGNLLLQMKIIKESIYKREGSTGVNWFYKNKISKVFLQTKSKPYTGNLDILYFTACKIYLEYIVNSLNSFGNTYTHKLGLKKEDLNKIQYQNLITNTDL